MSDQLIPMLLKFLAKPQRNTAHFLESAAAELGRPLASDEIPTLFPRVLERTAGGNTRTAMGEPNLDVAQQLGLVNAKGGFMKSTALKDVDPWLESIRTELDRQATSQAEKGTATAAQDLGQRSRPVSWAPDPQSGLIVDPHSPMPTGSIQQAAAQSGPAVDQLMMAAVRDPSVLAHASSLRQQARDVSRRLTPDLPVDVADQLEAQRAELLNKAYAADPETAHGASVYQQSLPPEIAQDLAQSAQAPEDWVKQVEQELGAGPWQHGNRLGNESAHFAGSDDLAPGMVDMQRDNWRDTSLRALEDPNFQRPLNSVRGTRQWWGKNMGDVNDTMKILQEELPPEIFARVQGRMEQLDEIKPLQRALQNPDAKPAQWAASLQRQQDIVLSPEQIQKGLNHADPNIREAMRVYLKKKDVLQSGFVDTSRLKNSKLEEELPAFAKANKMMVEHGSLAGFPHGDVLRQELAQVAPSMIAKEPAIKAELEQLIDLKPLQEPVAKPSDDKVYQMLQRFQGDFRDQSREQMLADRQGLNQIAFTPRGAADQGERMAIIDPTTGQPLVSHTKDFKGKISDEAVTTAAPTPPRGFTADAEALVPDVQSNPLLQPGLRNDQQQLRVDSHGTADVPLSRGVLPTPGRPAYPTKEAELTDLLTQFEQLQSSMRGNTGVTDHQQKELVRLYDALSTPEGKALRERLGRGELKLPAAANQQRLNSAAYARDRLGGQVSDALNTYESILTQAFKPGARQGLTAPQAKYLQALRQSFQKPEWQGVLKQLGITQVTPTGDLPEVLSDIAAQANRPARRSQA